MKKVLTPLIMVAMLATAAFATDNLENPLYAPAQMGFYSKTGLSYMYKKADDNIAMRAKGWEGQNEVAIFRIYEDFGFGITNWLALRGAFGYTHDEDIDRTGPHNARLGLNFRVIDNPKETVAWDIYADAWLAGISKMKATLIAAEYPQVQPNGAPYDLTFNYDNYGNGRWGAWFGTSIGKKGKNLTISTFGEAQVTFGNDNNEIKIDASAREYLNNMVKSSAISSTCDAVAAADPRIPSAAYCRQNAGSIILPPQMGGVSVDALATGIANAYTDEKNLPNSFSVDTKGTWDFAGGFKALYEIDNNWSVGGGYTWRHRATNSVEAVNIESASTVPNQATVKGITQKIKDSFLGSMEDGSDEFSINLLGSRKITEKLQLTLFGEYTYDIAEDKSQLGSDIKIEAGLRMNWQF